METTASYHDGMVYGAILATIIVVSLCIPCVLALAASAETRTRTALIIGLTLILPITVAVYLGYCIAVLARQAPRLLQKTMHPNQE